MAKAKKDKPSFGGTDERRKSSDWVYRSDAGAKPTEKRAPKAAAPARKATTKTPAASTAPKTATEATPNVASDRMAAAHALVDRYVKYGTAAGLVPIPAVDAVAIAGVQVKMLSALTAHYGVAYSQERGKTLIATILGGVVPSLAGYQMLKVFGPLAGLVSVAGFAAAATYAIGHVFIAHFESGGTLLDLDIDVARRKLADALSGR